MNYCFSKKFNETSKIIFEKIVDIYIVDIYIIIC